MIFEDGLQQRDFGGMHDVVVACRLALTRPDGPGHGLDVSGGRGHAVRAELATWLSDEVDRVDEGHEERAPGGLTL